MNKMKLTILGCYAATPRTFSNPTSQVLEIKNNIFLISQKKSCKYRGVFSKLYDTSEISHVALLIREALKAHLGSLVIMFSVYGEIVVMVDCPLVISKSSKLKLNSRFCASLSFNSKILSSFINLTIE